MGIFVKEQLSSYIKISNVDRVPFISHPSNTSDQLMIGDSKINAP